MALRLPHCPSLSLLARFVCAALLLFSLCESVSAKPEPRTRSRNVNPVNLTGFHVDDLTAAFQTVYDAIDKIAMERFGPDSGHYKRIRRSVPVKLMMLSAVIHTSPYVFDNDIFDRAQLFQIQDKKDSLWTRYKPSDPTRLRTAKTDLKLMMRSSVTLVTPKPGTSSEPRFIYEWKISELFGDYKVLANGEAPLRAANPATLPRKAAEPK